MVVDGRSGRLSVFACRVQNTQPSHLSKEGHGPGNGGAEGEGGGGRLAVRNRVAPRCIAWMRGRALRGMRGLVPG